MEQLSLLKINDKFIFDEFRIMVIQSKKIDFFYSFRSSLVMGHLRT